MWQSSFELWSNHFQPSYGKYVYLFDSINIPNISTFDSLQFFVNWQQFALKESNNINKLCLTVYDLWLAVKWWQRTCQQFTVWWEYSSVRAAGWVSHDLLLTEEWATLCLSNARLWRLRVKHNGNATVLSGPVKVILTQRRGLNSTG